MFYAADVYLAGFLFCVELPAVFTARSLLGSGLTGPHHHHLIVAMLADKSVSLLQCQRGLFTRTDGGMSGPELTDALPVSDAGSRFPGNILPVHF